MSKFKKQNIARTFLNAQKGMRLVLKSESNIRFHLLAAVFILIAAIILEFSAVKICVLLLTISAVICSEMLNSAIEFTLDAVFHNRYSRLVGMAKDIAAGAVLLSSIIAVIIGCILFIPPIIDLFT